MKKTSLNDIANRLGVSKTLVSLVLNGKAKEHRISSEVSHKVLKMAREMNYRPNQIAKGLRTGKTHTIGLVIADIANPFFGKLGREIENEASRSGYRVMFCSSDEKAEKAEQQIEMLRQGQMDGFIISPPAGSESQILSLEKGKIPYVLIDRFFPEIDSSYIVVDNFQASYDATIHLINRGYKNIACITINEKLVNMAARLEGFKKACADSELHVTEDEIKILPFSHEKDDVLLAVRQLLFSGKKKTDAILFTTSKIGIMGLECIHSLGARIPEDVAVVSFDDPDAYRISNPPVTAVAQPLKEIGSQAVKILVEQMQSPRGKYEKQKLVLKTNLIVRKSSGKP